jgi:hypothetical protein
MATKIDPFTSWSEIECRDGKKRKVYPAKLKYKDEIRDLSEKFNDTIIVSNIFDFKLNDEGKKEYSDEAWDAMLEILVLAFDNKFKKEEIEEFLDLSLAKKILETFYDISSLKKNNQ